MRYGYKRKVINKAPLILSCGVLSVILLIHKGFDSAFSGKYAIPYITFIVIFILLLVYAINLKRKLP